MILYYATGRDDLLEGVAPEALGDKYVAWKKWLQDNRPYMRAEPNGPRWQLDAEAKAQKGERTRYSRPLHMRLSP